MAENWIMSWVFLLLPNFLQHSSHTVCLQQTRRTCPLHTSFCISESPGRQRPWGKLVGSRAKQISFEFLVPLPKRLVLSDVHFVPFLERKMFPIGKHLYSHPWLPSSRLRGHPKGIDWSAWFVDPSLSGQVGMDEWVDGESNQENYKYLR